MSTGPAVIVRKGGFLTALVSGLFTFLSVVVLCAAGIAFYAIYVGDVNASRVLQVGSGLIGNVSQWRTSLPPALADALRDHRAPDYRSNVTASVRLVPANDKNEERSRAVIEVVNKGPQTISLLSLNLVLRDEKGDPVSDHVVYAATPIAVERDWRGPIQPGATRSFSRRIFDDEGHSATVEISDLRLTDPPEAAAATGPSVATETAALPTQK